MAKPDTPESCTLTVSYNGIEKPLPVNLQAATKAALEHALKLFPGLQNPHTLSLWSAAGKELQDNESLEEQGIQCEQTVLLRPSAVKGG